MGDERPRLGWSDLRGARVGVVLSGGNVDAATFADCIAAVSAVR